ncbi:hypothetical protein HYC85_029636 [Camellia sinensis]|uniref:alpha-1,2-Mannosidase n=1 Tax=Camellia sinensis TaxID=4442 RepID=A0A7J7FZ52_CAMSI|nr:hypothetical protein HYC85_029636 [Camellia sinensis]
MEDELLALQKTSTWELVPLPAGENLVGCKRVYKVKSHSDGSLERYKARLVAKGFSQEMFFLMAIFTEEVYMRPPLGLHHSSGQVYRLRACSESRSSVAFYARADMQTKELRSSVTSLARADCKLMKNHSLTLIRGEGCHTITEDSALFLFYSSVGFVALLLYVDDIIIIGSDSFAISEVKQHIFRTFEMKDLGPLRYFLGIEVAVSPKSYFLFQAKYANEVIHRAGLTDTKISDTPIKLNVKLNTTDDVLLNDPTLYRELVGCLVYLTVTRPNLAYAIHVVLVGDITAANSSHREFFSVWERFGVLPERYLLDRQMLHPTEKYYPLRPELAESTFYLYHATKDPWFLEVGESIVNSLNSYTKVEGGFASIRDVSSMQLEDHQHSFFLAETCKYLYLLFDDSFLVDRNYIFTTEGHPLPIMSAWHDRLPETYIPSNWTCVKSELQAKRASAMSMQVCPATSLLSGQSGEWIESACHIPDLRDDHRCLVDEDCGVDAITCRRRSCSMAGYCGLWLFI